ncbi:uncharacterized protein LOC131148654 isoform X2 [Malania oleifera]|uniref:uncharacterized protein LOC131148654 isoform X2 n=1 Tax=Malania oleifera TaxID=397392 RepID=UPI0025AE889A|nr:uncharacterized protein LOC131148654 isoform X2 [Malania oleifera]
MMDMDAPLDFESEDRLLNSVSTKKRKKVIGLDDLLTDYYKEKGKLVERESKQAKARKSYNSDEDDDTTNEAKFSQCVDECQQMMGQISDEIEISAWGIQMFGLQKPLPLLIFPELGGCRILQSFMNNEFNSLVELSTENGESFIKGLLVNGWLSKLVFTCGHVEKSVAIWTLNLMLYSPQEDLRTSAWDFWHAILSSINEVDIRGVKIDWLPEYSDLKRALDIYGFLFNFSSNSESVHDDSNCGPPQNIRAWIKYIAACCLLRGKHSIFSTSDAEELVVVIICLFLDRQLQGLSMLLFECLLSIIGYFTDNEWNTSCKKIAKSLASRDLNCLRTVECISGGNNRSKCLRSEVAYEILVTCFDSKVTEAEEILRLLMEINVKEKSCDLFKMYIYLVLTEHWLLSNPLFEAKPLIYEMWGVYLRNCSFQITGTDLRSYASKVRTKAAYLLQGTVNR